jgi:D-sedoheptulose 7-phosphate isomerase
MNAINGYITGLQELLDELPQPAIQEVIDLLAQARLEHRQVFILGNGGSASTASHFVCDLAKNTRMQGFPNYRVIGLSDNMPVFSALANDEGYENVFAGQLASFARAGDVVIAISASGKSPNVIKAVELARRMGARTVGMTGFDGGLLAGMVDHNIHVPSHCIEFVEDVHLMLEHLITKALRQQTLASLEHVRELVSGLDGVLSLEDMLERLLALSRDRLEASSGSIVLLGDMGGVELMALAYAGEVYTLSDAQRVEILRYGLAGWVVENRKAALITSTHDDPRWRLMPWEIDGAGSRSAISAPLMDQERVLGVLTLAHPEPGRFTPQDLLLLTAIAALAAQHITQIRSAVLQ